jgi:hypothetical protein
MRKIFLLVLIPALLALPSGAAAGELRLTIHNGLVTLIADEVPVSTIMAEWARIGQTKIVNGDKIVTPVSLQIVDTPERKALDIVLRTASGYMAAERAIPMAGASAFDSIMILPTSRPPANSGPIAAAPPSFVPRAVPMPAPDMDDEEPVVTPPGMGQPPVPGMHPGNQQPVPAGNQPGNQQPVPAQTPGMPNNAPLTAPRPGQLPQPAPQQPVPFGSPRPPGTGPGGGPGGGGAPVYEPDRSSEFQAQ